MNRHHFMVDYLEPALSLETSLWVSGTRLQVYRLEALGTVNIGHHNGGSRTLRDATRFKVLTERGHFEELIGGWSRGVFYAGTTH